MWHVQIVNQDGTIWRLPPVSEDKAIPVVRAMEEAYPEFEIGIVEAEA